jgi:hypothetical protein
MSEIVFEATARKIKGKEVAVWTDNLTISTDNNRYLKRGAYELVAGRTYKVTLTIEDVTPGETV